MAAITFPQPFFSPNPMYAYPSKVSTHVLINMWRFKIKIFLSSLPNHIFMLALGKSGKLLLWDEFLWCRQYVSHYDQASCVETFMDSYNFLQIYVTVCMMRKAYLCLFSCENTFLLNFFSLKMMKHKFMCRLHF
jgi:hypothetical protein